MWTVRKYRSIERKWVLSRLKGTLWHIYVRAKTAILVAKLVLEQR